MNNLPPNWSWVKLGDVCEIVMGQSPPSTTYNTDRIGLPFFQGKAEFTELYPEVRKWCSEPNKIAERLDILVSVRAPVGSTNIANQKCCIGRGLAALRYPDCNKFIFYYLRLIESKLDELGTGSTFKAISSATLKNFEIPLPPLPEQKKIVEKIEELFSGLDSGVTSLKKAKAQIRLYRQSVLASAFSGRLTQRAERQAHSELLAAEPKVEYSNQLPEGWKWVKTSEIIELIDNGYTPKADFMYSGNGEIPFIKVYNLTFNGKLNFSKNPIFIDKETHLKNLKRSITIPGDVLINIVGPPLGKVTIVPNTFKEWNINQAIVRFRPNKNILSKFLSYYLQNPKTIQWLESTSRATAGQYNIKVSTCREIPIPQISVEEQTQIVEEIEKRFSEADNLEKAIDESLAKSETLRQSILKQAFEGKLV